MQILTCSCQAAQFNYSLPKQCWQKALAEPMVQKTYIRNQKAYEIREFTKHALVT